MKTINHLCPQCGFRLDPDNPSQPVCPACGCDPLDSHIGVQDVYLAAVLDLAVTADAPQSANDSLGAGSFVESDAAYHPDPDLEFAIGQVCSGGCCCPAVLTGGKHAPHISGYRSSLT